MRTNISVIALVLIIILTACNRHSKHWKTLCRVESYIEEKPDSALSVLQQLNPNNLISKEEKAKHALLLSMAMDKNYIDATNFDILQPAIDYYPQNGTANEKLRTYYYQGRIFQNSNDKDGAMNCFIRALDQTNNATDSLTITRALVAQAFIFYQVYQIDKYVDNYLKAANIYSQLGNNAQRIDCLLSAWNGSILQDDHSKADSLRRICEVEVPTDNAYFNSQKLSHILKYGSDNEIRLALNDFDSTQNYSLNDWLNIANAYNRIGEAKTAKQIIEQCQQPVNSYERLKYEGIYYAILDSMGDFEGALTHYKIFDKKLSEVHSTLFEDQVQFSEQRHKLELEHQKEIDSHNRVIYISIGALLILVMGTIILFWVVRANRAQKILALERLRIIDLENENLRHRIDLLENEKDNLGELLESQSSLPDKVRQTIKIRIEMLNSILASQISSNEQYEKSYEKWMRDLTTNIDEFMNSNRIAFSGTHPKFIKYFEEHGLSTDEINYVCLYAIGLKGKEVGTYMKRPSHINISSAIRRKLDMDKHETNLGIYVRRLLNDL